MTKQEQWHDNVLCDRAQATGRLTTVDGKRSAISNNLALKLECLINGDCNLTEDELLQFRNSTLIPLRQMKNGKYRLAAKVVLGPHFRTRTLYSPANQVPPMPQDGGPRMAPNSAPWP